MAIIFPNSQTSEVVGESWRITSNFSGDNNYMGHNSMTNWEKADDVYGGGNNTANILSESNGAFSFNADYRGWYAVYWHHYVYWNDNERYNEMALYVSWNQGANWDVHGWATVAMSPNTSANYNQCASCMSTVNGTANARLRFGINSEINSSINYGATDGQGTGFTIIKIADN